MEDLIDNSAKQIGLFIDHLSLLFEVPLASRETKLRIRQLNNLLGRVC